jgi:transcriptional regulator GlxA family with amidase domain
MDDLKRLMPALELMEKELSEPIPVSRLAQAVGYSEVQFRRIFERMMGKTPVQHLRQIRIEEACRLLRRTSQTLESISSEVGYQEPAFFAHTFKKIMGISPGEYRRSSESHL